MISWLSIYRFSPDPDYSLDRQKWESFIEKITPDSPDSSETPEDDPETPTILPQTTPSPNPPVPMDPFKAVDSHNESLRTWLQKITQMQTEIQKKISLENHSSVPLKSFSEFIAPKPTPELIPTPVKVNRVVSISQVLKWKYRMI